MALGFVRPARPGDAPDIARIQLATWRVAYRRLVPAHILDQMDEHFLRERWLDSIVNPPTPRHRVLVAVEQAAQEYLVGFVATGPSDDDPAVAAITEFLVEPRWGRRGHGSRLLAAAADHWRDDGHRSAQMWVFEQDPATTKFLTSAGWAPAGLRRELDVDDMLVPQVLMHTSLDASASDAADGPGTAPSPRLEQLPETDGEPGTFDHGTDREQHAGHE